MGVTEVKSNDWLESAKVGVDLPRKRGDVFRGAYIVSDCGRFYMGKDGSWSDGISPDDNHWWETESLAKAHLRSVIQKKLSNDTDHPERG